MNRKSELSKSKTKFLWGICNPLPSSRKRITMSMHLIEAPPKLHLPRRWCGQQARSTPKHHKKWRAGGVGYESLGDSRPSCGLTERPQLRNELRQPHRTVTPAHLAGQHNSRVSRPKSLQRNLAVPRTSVPKHPHGQAAIYDLTAE